MPLYLCNTRTKEGKEERIASSCSRYLLALVGAKNGTTITRYPYICGGRMLAVTYSSLVLIIHGPQVVAATRERASKAAVPFPTAIFVCSFQFILGSSHTPSTLSFISGLISSEKPSILIVLARSPVGSLLRLVKCISLYLSGANFEPCLLDQSMHFLCASSRRVQFS